VNVRGPKVGVVALQGDVREHRRALEQAGATPVGLRVPADCEEISGIVIPGGESTTLSLLIGSSGLEPELRARIRDGMPVLGTCAGMILLATSVLDGRPDQVHLDAIDIAVRRNAFGRQSESFETELDVKGLVGGPMHAVFIRAPYVEEIGPGVEVLATVQFHDYRAGEEVSEVRDRPVVCRQGSVTTAAFHPELTGDLRLHQLFLSDIEGD